MNQCIEDKIEEIYNSLMEKPLKILEIFNDFFGEERVDMQGHLSLEEFKLRINNTPIDEYIIYKFITDIDKEEWNNIKHLSITSIDEKYVEIFKNVLDKELVKEYISGMLNNIFIIVHFPHITLTNENDKSVNINNLWAKVRINLDGTINGCFSLNRSEYTMLHISSNFLHSHVKSVPKSNFTIFQSPCLGTGPIRETISSLTISYDEDLWNLFCLELSKYVTVESIKGRPYHYLEKLGTNNLEICENTFPVKTQFICYWTILDKYKLRDFIRYFISLKKLKFNFINGSYSIGMPHIEYMLLVSNAFIEWYNKKFNNKEIESSFDVLKSSNLLKECIIDNGKIYNYTKIFKAYNNQLRYIGEKVCTFKGRDITIDITDKNEIEENNNKSIILNKDNAMFILTIILRVLNYRYGRNKAIYEYGKFGTEVKYL